MRDVLLVLGAEVPSGRAVAKKLRAEHYCCMLMASGISASQVAAQSPAGIILAGEEREGAHLPDAQMLSLGIPVLALGSSARALLDTLGPRSEQPPILDAVVPVKYKPSPLFEEVEAGERWIGCAASFSPPEPFKVIADSAGYPLAFADEAANQYLLQFQIERNDPDGMAMLLAFADSVCGCTPWWTSGNIIADAEKSIQSAVRDGEAICALSGGLDSTVAALLAKHALGDRARCVFVDTGLLRQGEAEETEGRFRDELQFNCVRVDASAKIMEALRGLTTVDDKWRVIEQEINRALLAEAERTPGDKVFVKGTNYVDVLGGEIPEDAGPFERVIEPLRELFKDEIRLIGESLALSPAMLQRQPFPGMGMAARIRGEVTPARLGIIRTADALFAAALRESGQDKRLARFFVMLDEINGQDVIVLRATLGAEPNMNAARLPSDLLERCVEQIRKELPSVGRVLYDLTPGAAEWLR